MRGTAGLIKAALCVFCATCGTGVVSAAQSLALPPTQAGVDARPATGRTDHLPLASPAQSDGDGAGNLAGAAASADAQFAAGWVLQRADHQHKPFAIVDKKNARIFVFGSDGRLRGASAVLLGRGIGDLSVPDISTRPLASLTPREQTTPSGRFASEPGHNLQGEDIVWVDYSARVAIHRLRADSEYAQRAQRLTSSATDDKRMSMGCIVVPVRFYADVVRPVLGRAYGVVYVLPEDRPTHSLFDLLPLDASAL